MGAILCAGCGRAIFRGPTVRHMWYDRATGSPHRCDDSHGVFWHECLCGEAVMRRGSVVKSFSPNLLVAFDDLPDHVCKPASTPAAKPASLPATKPSPKPKSSSRRGVVPV